MKSLIRLRVFFIPFALLTLSPCCLPQGLDGLQLFHKMQTALGGAERIASVRDFEQIVHAESWLDDGTPRSGVVRKRVRFIRPNYLRIDQVGPGDTYVLYFDGTSGWEILPDGTVAQLAGDELNSAQSYLRGLNLNFWLADRDPSRVITSSGSAVIVIATKGDSPEKIEITLDPVTFLPARQAEILHAGSDHPIHQELRFDQWEASGGVKFPKHVSNLHDGSKRAEITADMTRLNNNIKQSDLAIKPPDLKPVMSSP
jgi:hypothetical protein